ncbi:putative FHY3/FAR1 family protein [Helianthus annuus]|nr:putative FHY3/FAR1 family protein [Helianthus annuus]KAJ0776140.1 putative FHY3/FAR1 family protein [Helianthus annuus]
MLSDQDPSMLQAVPMVFTESRHRLCMWHIMKKLPSKISADVLDNTDLRSCIHRLVWNVYIKPETFESRWNDLLQTFGLQEHSWLNDMYNMRHLWVPAYFRELPMCCLMKTTSRCESSNAAFKVNSTSANTLVQFMMCFENRVDSQRYRQRVSEFKTSSTMFTGNTELAIEQHAFAIYTNAVFAQVQKEIIKGKFLCYITNQSETSDCSLLIDVTHLDKRNNITNVYQVTYNNVDQSANCSCRNFTRIRNYQEYFVVHDIGIKTGDTFRFNFSNTNTALSSAAAVSSHLRSLNQGSNNTTGGDKREVFGGLIFTSPDASFFGQPDVNSSPFLDNFPGVAFGGTFCSRVIGRSVLTPYIKEFQEPKAVGCCVHAYCAVYLVMSYTMV